MSLTSKSDIISVIVPVYNVEKYIGRCMDSLLKQTYHDLEIILVNDGSTDSSGKMIDDYAEKYEHVTAIHKENGGQSSARNVGLDAAKGSYIGFVDSDDWIDPEMFGYLMKILKETGSDVSDISVVFAHEYKHAVKQDDDFQLQIFEGRDMLVNYLHTGLSERTGQFSVYRKLFKRELFQSVRFEEGRINEDILINYQLLQKARRLVRSSRIMYFYFQDDQSTTRNGLRKKDFDLLFICGKIVELAGDDPQLRHYAEIKMARSYFSLLAKIAYYGVKDPDIDRKDTIKTLTRKLRRNFGLLIRSQVPLSRKLLIVLFCVDFRIVTLPLKLIRSVKR